MTPEQKRRAMAEAMARAAWERRRPPPTARGWECWRWEWLSPQARNGMVEDMMAAVDAQVGHLRAAVGNGGRAA